MIVDSKFDGATISQDTAQAAITTLAWIFLAVRHGKTKVIKDKIEELQEYYTFDIPINGFPKLIKK